MGEELAESDRPPVHPRLRDPRSRAELAAAWRAERRVRIPDALPPGVAAELLSVVLRLPVATVAVEDHAGLWWGCEVEVPREPEPQHPACLLRLARFLAEDLPELSAVATGTPLSVADPFRIHVRILRKGAFVDPQVDPPGSSPGQLWLGLTAARWPAEWGGHMEWLAAERAPAARMEPGWNTLDLIGVGAQGGYAIPVLRRHVDAIALVDRLVPAPARA